MEYLDCGCIVQTMCPLHAQAEGMRTLLQTLTQIAIWDGQSKIGQTKEYLVPFHVVERARALLRAVEGK